MNAPHVGVESSFRPPVMHGGQRKARHWTSMRPHSWSKLAVRLTISDLAHRLQEPNEALLARIVKVLGVAQTEAFCERTLAIEAAERTALAAQHTAKAAELARL